MFQIDKNNDNNLRQTENEFNEYLLNHKQSTKPKSLLAILWENAWYISIMLFSTFLLTLSNLGKGGPKKPSIFGFERCSFLSFAWFFLCLVLICLTSLFGYVAYKKEQSEKSQLEQNLLERGQLKEKCTK
jgi:uncharacterized membrane protein SpoIIM required for sporulation